MNLVRQDGHPECCGHCCIAMIAGVTLDDVIAVIGHTHRTGSLELTKALRHYGFTVKDERPMIDFHWPPAAREGTLLCDVFSLIDPNYSHAVVYHKGQLYDPWHGINPEWPWHRRITSYIFVPEK